MNSYLFRQYQEGHPFASAVNPMPDEVAPRSIRGGSGLGAGAVGLTADLNEPRMNTDRTGAAVGPVLLI
jgi:hypothetical protein